MTIEELRIDNDYKSCLPDLSVEEYTNLEKNIIKHGVISPIVIWDKTIIDGHNRYSICKAHGIKEVPVKEIEFDSKESALEWILGNQLSRRNLSDYQKNVIALKYKEVIAAKMKERMSAGGGDRKSSDYKIGVDQEIIPDSPKTTTRRELAKIAGTSESSIQRTELILKEGTEEQKERAMKGGKGNEIAKIAKEIKEKDTPMKICSVCGAVKPLSVLNRAGESTYICKSCDAERNRKNRSEKIDEGVIKAAERLKSGEFAEYTSDDVLNEMKWLADGFKRGLDAIISEHEDIMREAGETIITEAFEYIGEIFRKDENYADFI